MDSDKCLKYIQAVRDAKGLAFIDPMTLAMRYDSCHRCEILEYYPFIRFGETPASLTRKLRTEIVRGLIDYQASADCDIVLTPGVWFDGPSDPWLDVNIDLAELGVNYSKRKLPDKEVFVPIYMDGTDLKNDALMLECADRYTTLDVAGFYLCLDPMWNEAAPSRDAELLTNWMHFVNRLHGNGYRVILGYLDSAAVLLSVAGAWAFGSGLFYTNRKFHLSQWVGREEGIRKKSIKFYSPVLLNFLNVDGQLTILHDLGLLKRIKGDAKHADVLFDGRRPSSSLFGEKDSQRSYLTTMHRLARSMNGLSLVQRHNVALNAIAEGTKVYMAAMSKGMRFDPNSGPDHLVAFATALRSFMATRKF